MKVLIHFSASFTANSDFFAFNYLVWWEHLERFGMLEQSTKNSSQIKIIYLPRIEAFCIKVPKSYWEMRPAEFFSYYWFIISDGFYETKYLYFWYFIYIKTYCWDKSEFSKILFRNFNSWFHIFTIFLFWDIWSNYESMNHIWEFSGSCFLGSKTIL